jgi:hypothetical protein
MAAPITPLDPDSDKGREVADRLSQVLAEIFHELDTAQVKPRPDEQEQPRQAA